MRAINKHKHFSKKSFFWFRNQGSATDAYCSNLSKTGM